LEWMHTPTIDNSGSSTAVGSTFNDCHHGCCSLLRELHFVCVTDSTFADYNAAREIARMLLLQTSTNNTESNNGNDGNAFIATIGSQIRTLSLGRFDTTNHRCSSHLDVLLQLSRSSKRVQLAVVQLDVVDAATCLRLQEVLPKLTSVRALHIGLPPHCPCHASRKCPSRHVFLQ
jgi:hypothetical protein